MGVKALWEKFPDIPQEREYGEGHGGASQRTLLYKTKQLILTPPCAL